MTILIVDDQKAIVESLEKGIHWEQAGITEVYTACSAKEAKLILVNFEIDILLTDIEMPEEDGLSLFRWSRERFPNLLGIFLTSHADFSYAKEAIQLGGFDYVLQPARYEEVEEVLSRAIKVKEKEHHIQKLEKTTILMDEQRDSVLELMDARIGQGKKDELPELCNRLRELFNLNFKKCMFLPLKVEILKFVHFTNQWDEKLLKLVFRNVIEELFEEKKAKVCVSSRDLKQYLLFVVAESGSVTEEEWKQGMEQFFEFIMNHMDFSIAVYPFEVQTGEFHAAKVEEFISRKENNAHREAAIFWERSENSEEMVINEERIKNAVAYIKDNISKSISRSEVAEHLHLNEEYFTRLFKQYTGYTFKDYEMMERIKQAQKLLKNTRFSISIIASKVGYDNFSHFSKTFKKMTGSTPQEYRKEKQKKS